MTALALLSRLMSVGKRLAFTAIIQLLCLLLLELGLRAVYPRLPSLMGASSVGAEKAAAFSGTPPGSCDFAFDQPVQPRGAGLVVLGDSITAGVGVTPPTLAYANLLVGALPGLTLQPIARAGADLCMELRWLRTRLGLAPWPRAVVWEVFADDLMPWMVYGVSDRPFAVPQAEPSAVWRWLAERSYLGNLLWFQVRLHGAGGEHRMVADADQRQILSVLAQLQAQLSSARIPIVPVLMEPAGWPTCPEASDPADACSWMGTDLELLAGLLSEARLPAVDMRGVWAEHPSVVIPAEIGARPPRDVPIHPDATGHALIADAILPVLQQRLAETE